MSSHLVLQDVPWAFCVTGKTGFIDTDDDENVASVARNNVGRF